MTDIVNKATRSRMMSGIRGKNTLPEVLIRKGLFALGFRYRLHTKHLPGKPDIVFPGRKAVIFVNGCFWHYHDCYLFKMPGTNRRFWRKKLLYNRKKDTENHKALKKAGWRILTIWECAFRENGKKYEKKTGNIVRLAAIWLASGKRCKNIRSHRSKRRSK